MRTALVRPLQACVPWAWEESKTQRPGGVRRWDSIAEMEAEGAFPSLGRLGLMPGR